MKLTYNDRQHAYWLNGTRCKGVTTVAKIPDDTYGLDRWRNRQIVVGMASSPPLVSRAAAHYDERDKLDEIADEAMVAAKAHEASGRGTATHRITERVDLDLAWIDTPEARLIVEQWTAALDTAGLDIVPELVERIVVYPDQLVAGRFDRVARRRSDGRLVVVDVKTGENAVKYPHSTAIQLALYANAPILAGPLTRTGQSETTETFEPLPDGIDREVGVIVYLPPEGPAKVYELDIAAGWQAATGICFPTLEWRRRTGLVNQLAEAAPKAPADRIDWLRSRTQAIKTAGHLEEVARQWPAGVPTLKQGGLTDDQINQVALVLDKIEARHEIPFGPTDPLFTGLGPTEPPPPTPPAPVPDPNAEARANTTAAQGLLEQFDENEQAAIVRLVVPDGAKTTSQHVEWIETLCAELDDPNGTVMFAYSTLGPEITSTDNGDRVRRHCRTKTEARLRGARLAQLTGRPTPRTFDLLCADPLLAALVAAGHGQNPTTNNSQENQTP